MVESIAGSGFPLGTPQKKHASPVGGAAANTAFCDLLASSGETNADSAGAASANTAAAASTFQISTLRADLAQWLAQYGNGNAGANSKNMMSSSAAAFEQLMQKASAQGGYQDPQAFLQTLSPSELKTLQDIHSLADPINPASLTKEGALNLLMPPNDLQDIDNDGFEMVGVAKTWQFPPVNAPADVKAAWDKTTANLSGSDKMLLAMSFAPSVSLTGTTADAYIGPDADYSQIIKKAIEGLQYSLPYNQSQQADNIRKQITLLQDFASELQSA